jgi:hypothetical protein
MYSERDLNPHNRNGHKILSLACLPFHHPSAPGAENETRTRDPNLGKVMLYQLSYFRNIYYLTFGKAFRNIYSLSLPRLEVSIPYAARLCSTN